MTAVPFDKTQPSPDASSAETPDPAFVARIHANHKRFLAETETAERKLAAGHADEAVMHASLAAAICAHTHCGVFASSRLEKLIHAVAATIPDNAPVFRRARSAAEIQRVLHIGTEVVPVGGLTRMISRWMDADAARINSFAVTRQRHAVPEHLVNAVKRSGGEVYRLNTQPGSQLDWAKRLREISRGYDLVILHTHCEDLIPLIAFVPGETVPPVLLLNHADHLFWLGPSVCHGVLNLREAAHDITVNRRGLAPERSLLLPTLVDPAKRGMTREQARESLQIKPDATLLLSVARGSKYRTMDGVSYADRFVGVLKANPKARLLVVGPGSREDWRAASEQTAGRIVGLPEQAGVQKYFEAADIYVDSYPFSSSTSLMEAASYGLPLLTLFTLPHEGRLLGINHLGLAGGTIQALTPRDWESSLSRLIREPALRQARAQDALKAVACAQPPEWLTWLQAAYQRATELPPIPSPPAPTIDIDTPRSGEPDWRHEAIYGLDHPLAELTRDYMCALPLPARLRVWNRLRAAGEVKGLAALRLLPPEWLKRRLKG